jgi:hypothetical protein
MRRQHHRQRFRPRLFITLSVDGGAQRQPGIVDDDIERAEFLRNSVDDSCNVIGLGDIERPCLCLAARRRDFIDDRSVPSEVRSVTATLAPSSANTRAVARPMPLAAPVTRTVRPLTERLSCL